jgi:hypothetical protein
MPRLTLACAALLAAAPPLAAQQPGPIYVKFQLGSLVQNLQTLLDDPAAAYPQKVAKLAAALQDRFAAWDFQVWTPAVSTDAQWLTITLKHGPEGDAKDASLLAEVELDYDRNEDPLPVGPALTLYEAGMFRPVWVSNQGEQLFDEIRGRFTGLFLKKAGEHREKFRKVPVAQGLVKFVPPSRAILPLSWERFKYWSLSTFHMYCLDAQRNLVVVYSKGSGEADPPAGGPKARLVVEHDQVKVGNAAPIPAANYRNLAQLLRGRVFLVTFEPNPQFLTVDRDTAILRP